MAAPADDARNGAVKNGIDVLEEHGFRELRIRWRRPGERGTGDESDRHGRARGDGRLTCWQHAPGVEAGGDIQSGTRNCGQGRHHGYSELSGTRRRACRCISVYGETDAKRRPTDGMLCGPGCDGLRHPGCGRAVLYLRDDAGVFPGGGGEGGQARWWCWTGPNPVGGAYRAGPVADAGRESFVSYWQMPMRHGMTMGELARMFNGERGHRGAS